MFGALLFVQLSPITGAKASAAGSPIYPQKLGFGFVGDPDQLVATGYSPSTFYKGMYQTPPFPSVSEMNIANPNHWSGSGDMQFIDSVGSMLGNNQYLMLDLGIRNVPTDTLQFLSYMNHLGNQNWKSHLIVGIDGEHTTRNVTAAIFDSLENAIISNGIRAINRYGAGLPGVGANYSWIGNTNWPFAGRQGTATGNDVGIMVGLSLDAPFPSQGCGPSGNGDQNNGYPGWSLIPYAQGFLSPFPGSYACAQDWPATIPYVLSTNNGAGGEFIMFNAGYADSCWYLLCPSPSVGASGLTTNVNWDNLQFRGAISQWLATNSNDYITGNSQPPPTSTSSSSSTPSTTTASSSSKPMTSTAELSTSSLTSPSSTTPSSTTPTSTGTSSGTPSVSATTRAGTSYATQSENVSINGTSINGTTSGWSLDIVPYVLTVGAIVVVTIFLLATRGGREWVRRLGERIGGGCYFFLRLPYSHSGV